VGIGQANPASKLDIKGGLTVGSNYSGNNTAPSNGAIFEGKVGIGQAGPAYKLDVAGDINWAGELRGSTNWGDLDISPGDISPSDIPLVGNTGWADLDISQGDIDPSDIPLSGNTGWSDLDISQSDVTQNLSEVLSQANSAGSYNIDMSGNYIKNANRINSQSGADYPRLVLHSTSSGDNWTDQGSYISIGESGALGGASMHMTYRGDGYGFVGSGSVSNAEPGGSYLRFDYNSSNIYTPNKLTVGSFKVNQSSSNGDVLTSDGSGNANWQDPQTLVNGDNLGNHSATQNLDMNNNNVNDLNRINFNSGEYIDDGSDLVLGSNGGYIEFEPSDGTHGLIMRDFDGGNNWSGIRTQDNGRMELRADDASYSQLQLQDDGDVIANAGNVGVQETSPSNLVDINVGSSNSDGISLDGQVAVSARDGNEWLRLNQNNGFSNGIYTPGKLYINGTLRVDNGSPSANKVLTATDGNGNTTWKDISSAGIGDNLGNHSATQNLDMSGNSIDNIGSGTDFNLGEGLEFISKDLGGAGNDGRVIRLKDSNNPNSPDGHFMVASGDDNAKLMEFYDVGVRTYTNMDMQSNRIVDMADPSNAQDAATKSYVDGKNHTDNQDLANVLNRGNGAGGTDIDMDNQNIDDLNNIYGGNGNLDIYSTSNDRVLLRATGSGGELGWYDDYNNQWILRHNNGGDLSVNPINDVDMSGNYITNLATPNNSSDAATKGYVDGKNHTDNQDLSNVLNKGNGAGSNNIDMDNQRIYNVSALEVQSGDQNILLDDGNPSWIGNSYGGIVKIYGDGSSNDGKLEVGGVEVLNDLTVDERVGVGTNPDAKLHVDNANKIIMGRSQGSISNTTGTNIAIGREIDLSSGSNVWDAHVGIGQNADVSSSKSGFAIGYGVSTESDYSVAIGINSTAKGGSGAHVFGNQSTANGQDAYAIGDNVTNTTTNSIKMGISGSGIFISSNNDVGIGTDDLSSPSPVSNSRVVIEQQSDTDPAIAFVAPGEDDNWEINVDDGGSANYQDLNFYWEGTHKASVDDYDGSWDQTSDRRLKKNIKDIENLLPKVKELNPVTYEMKHSTKSSEEESQPKRNVGLIAQEVNKYFPSIANKQGKYYTMSYGEIGVVAIQALQEQQQIIEQQKRKNEKLQEELDQIKSRLNALEAKE